ncbi:hypothetical protein ADK41_20585 [Streptomyces caelestis]|uniref:Uncharacterized protein n=1 Tax=Streptomyces caelestis TaxID=36816 RepID=A0A0M8QQN6_9ACTN|nr:hypothetical protein ADK41_20585 [Streptomyces caelestis]
MPRTVRVCAGRRVEGAVARDDGRVLVARLEAVPLPHADHLLPTAVRPEPDARLVRPAVRRLAHGFPAGGAFLHGPGEQPAGGFAAPVREADGGLRGRAAMEPGRTARRYRGAGFRAAVSTGRTGLRAGP